MLIFTDKQKLILTNLLEKSYEGYHKGYIILSEYTLTKYKNVEFAMMNKTQISKSCLDFVLTDIQNNFHKDPLFWKFGDILDEEEIIENFRKN